MINLENDLYLFYQEYNKIAKENNKNFIIDIDIFYYFKLCDKYNLNSPFDYINFINNKCVKNDASKLFIDIQLKVLNTLKKE